MRLLACSAVLVLLWACDCSAPICSLAGCNSGCCDATGACAAAEVCATSDAGTADAGTIGSDAGVPVDAGPVDDGGQGDAGVPDAGVPDAGPIDAGAPDAGVPDAGIPDAGKLDAGGFISDGGLLCTSQGWCWLNPRPQGDTINDIYGTGPADVWAVTKGGTAIHWNGASWTLHELTLKSSLEGIWAASANDVWAVGRGLHRWNGSTWSADAGNVSAITQPVNAIWGSGPKDIWAVGDFSSVARFNGSVWTSVPNAAPLLSTLQSIRGRNANDVHLVGSGGTFSSFNGTAWTIHTGFGGGWIYAVWPAAANDIWVVGAGLAARWDGTTRTGFSESFANFEAAWGSAPNDIWLAGTGSSNDFRHWDGTTLSQVMPARQGVKALWGTAQNDVWVGGYGGRLGHFDGATWSDVSTRFTAQMDALWSCTPGRAWSVGPYVIARYDGTTMAEFLPKPAGFYAGVWCSSETDVWVAGTAGVQRWNGAAWTPVPTPVGVTISPEGIWGTGPNDVWISGSGLFMHWNGSAWQQFTPNGTGPTTARRIAGSSPNNVWFAGTNEQVFQWDGTSLSRRSTLGNDVNPDVWVSAAGTAFLVTRTNSGVKLQRWNGTAWDRNDAPANAYLFPFTIGGTSESDLWMMGLDGEAMHWDGTSLASVDKGTNVQIQRIRQSGSSLFALGAQGELLVK